MAGELHEGGSFSGTVTNADGNTYINCVFTPYCLIEGDGITFVNCAFLSNCNSNPPQMILVPGTGSVLEGGVVNDACTIFGMATVVGNLVVWNGVAGPFSNVQGGMYEFSKPLISTSKDCRPCTNVSGDGAGDAVLEDLCRIQCTDNDAQSDTGQRDNPLGGI